MSSSVVVVEIDTRKSGMNTLFESSIEHQTEQAKQFWKTLTLSPHIESSLYSKEILQQIKANTLKPMAIDNSRKVPTVDQKTQAYLNQVQVLNQVDEIVKIQKKAAKIDNIKQMHKARREKLNQINHISRTALIKSESESKWITQLSQDTNDESFYNEKINEDDYEMDYTDLHDEDMVKNLD